MFACAHSDRQNLTVSKSGSKKHAHDRRGLPLVDTTRCSVDLNLRSMGRRLISTSKAHAGTGKGTADWGVTRSSVAGTSACLHQRAPLHMQVCHCHQMHKFVPDTTRSADLPFVHRSSMSPAHESRRGSGRLSLCDGKEQGQPPSIRVDPSN